MRQQLDKHVIAVIDLDTVPRVRNHFRHMEGVSRSEKVITDSGLRSRADEIVREYELLSASTSERDQDLLRQASLTKSEVVNLRDVVDNAHLWSRSQLNMDELYKALSRYHVKAGSRTMNRSAYHRALQEVQKLFATSGFWAVKPNPLSQGSIPFQSSKSSGWPVMTQKSEDEVRGLKEARRIVTSSRRFPPCVAGFRVQQKGTGPKSRLVFMYPMSMTLIEGMFAPIVTSRIKQHVQSITYAEGLGQIGQKSHAVRRSRYVLETDFSAFDATIPAFMIRDCFSILRSGFKLDEFESIAWDRMVEYFINTPILMPDGRVYATYKGVPSGSWFTNIIDSMINLLSVYYSKYRSGVSGKVLACVMGDDAIIGTEQELSLEDWSRFASELGLVMSPEKSKRAVYDSKSRMNYTAAVPFYLGRYWTESGAWYRQIHITLARLLYHERFTPGDVKALRLNRMASLAMDNPMASVVILHLLTGDTSRCFRSEDTGREDLVRAFYYEARSLGITNLYTTKVTGFAELMGSLGDRRDETFTFESYSRNTWKGRMVPTQV